MTVPGAVKVGSGSAGGGCASRAGAIALDDVVIGKDVLELVSSAMYVEPMTIYREYIQNSADAADEARRQGLLGAEELGRVDISIDPSIRSVRIRDNGTGLPWRNLIRRLTALGASTKRGGPARGFRGVGRLAGLGYAQHLIFRSRVDGERLVSELTWDCRALRAALRSSDNDPGVAELIQRVVSTARVDGTGFPGRFFEVELRGVVRMRSDKLMNPAAIADYLSQVAPLPFAPTFPFRDKINAVLRPWINLGDLDVRISGIEGSINRPHHAGFVDDDQLVRFEDVEILEIPNMDGGIAAIAWLLHHAYDGAVPSAALVKGLRLRSGNIQVGDYALIEELFQEPRFNGWSIGEIHIVDPRIIPNGRRDNFEQNAHYGNLLNHLAPTARSIGRRCRTNSKRRQLLREFEAQATSARERLSILEQGSLGATARGAQTAGIENIMARMTKILEAGELANDRTVLRDRLDSLRKEVRALKPESADTPLAHLPPKQRATYEHFFNMVYECSTNRVAAKALVDRLLAKILEPPPVPVRRPVQN